MSNHGSTGSKTVAIGAGCLLLVAPMVLVITVFALTADTQACPAPTPPTPGSQTTTGVSVAHANIKTTLPAPAFAADLDTTLRLGPDLVSLNEVSTRADASLTRPGYGLWREPDPAVRGADGTAVLWRTDRWQLIDRGRVVLLDHGPQKWDRDRAATWVTLERPDAAEVVSMVSVHQMINPARYGPNMPLRQQLYRQGMERLNALVTDLQIGGRVYVAGDFNSQYTDNDPWGPRAMLGAVGLSSSMDDLGVRPTHDGGGTIDYVFGPADEPAPSTQQVTNLRSDHHLLQIHYPGRAPIAAAAVRSDRDDRADLGLDEVQWTRAREIVQAGRAAQVPANAVVIALMVASQESGFRVYANDGLGGDLAADQTGVELSMQMPHDAVGTDHGSVGLFQQQWPWWGAMDALMDAATSAGLFYQALLSVPGWENMPKGSAAQAVQRSAHPSAYDDEEDLAFSVLASLSTTTTTTAVTGSCSATTNQGTGAVVMPIPATAGAVDLHNWGGSGSHWARWHTGTDFSVACGTPVVASHDGTVQIDTTEQWAGPWLVKVARGPGDLTTWYAHMEELDVAAGQTVTAGQRLGTVGAEGNATGCHLHFEVHTTGGPIYGDDNVDPSAWLARHVPQPATAATDHPSP